MVLLGIKEWIRGQQDLSKLWTSWVFRWDYRKGRSSTQSQVVKDPPTKPKRFSLSWQEIFGDWAEIGKGIHFDSTLNGFVVALSYGGCWEIVVCFYGKAECFF